jgi:hypothetical protein
VSTISTNAVVREIRIVYLNRYVVRRCAAWLLKFFGTDAPPVWSAGETPFLTKDLDATPSRLKVAT